MKKMSVLGSSHQQLITMISEDMHHLEGLLFLGTKVFSLACVMPTIIMDIRLSIIEPMHETKIEFVRKEDCEPLKENM